MWRIPLSTYWYSDVTKKKININMVVLWMLTITINQLSELQYQKMYLQICVAPDKVFFYSNRKVLVFFLFLHKTYIVDTHKKCLFEALLMNTHNICFHGEIR